METFNLVHHRVVFSCLRDVPTAVLLGLFHAHVDARGPGEATRRQATKIYAGAGSYRRQRQVGVVRPLLPPVVHDPPARSAPVESANLRPVHAVVIDHPRGQQQMRVAVSRIVGSGVDGPLTRHAPDAPKPGAETSRQPTQRMQGQLVGQRQDDRASNLRVPSLLRPFTRLPVHGANGAGGENLPGLATVVVDAAGAFVHLARAGGVGPLIDGRFALPA